MTNEPVLTAVTAFVGASLVLLAAFGLDFTDEQVAAILGFVAALYGLALVIRSKVTPTAKLSRTALKDQVNLER